jgi:hypothetical protein
VTNVASVTRFIKDVGLVMNGLLVVVSGSKKLTPVQQWLIGAGAIFALRNSLPTDRLGDHSPVHGFIFRKQIKELLLEAWGVKTKKQLLRAINSLRIEGLREYCYKQELEQMETRQDRSHLDKNRYLIWDYCRIIQLYRWGYILDWFGNNWCWEQMLQHAKEIQLHYTSWEDMVTAYLRGRELWAGERLEDTDEFEEAAEWLKKDENSPWQVDWDLELKKDW